MLAQVGDEATAAGNRQRYTILQRTVAKLAKAGAKMALGSDTGIQDHPFGITDHRELELLVESGMTPMQVLVAATSTSAAYLELADEGALAAGKRANSCSSAAAKSIAAHSPPGCVEHGGPDGLPLRPQLFGVPAGIVLLFQRPP